MKKFCITFLLSGIIILSAIGFGTGILGSGSTANTNTEYLRIHIRANSNGGEDQAVKYMVRDAVVDYLTPFVAEAETKEEAMSLMNGQLSRIAQVADGLGFEYPQHLSRMFKRQEGLSPKEYCERLRKKIRVREHGGSATPE